MSKPTKHYGKWRIRWVDEHGERQSAVHDEFKTALLVLRQNELQADERRRGLRDPLRRSARSKTSPTTGSASELPSSGAVTTTRAS